METAQQHLEALYANVSDVKETPKKTEDGVAYPASDYACVPDRSKPSTWKLRLSQGKPGNITAEQLGRAAAAFSEGGHRGNRVELPSGCSADSVKARIRREYRKLGVKAEDMPDSIKETQSPQVAFIESFKNRLLGFLDYMKDQYEPEPEPEPEKESVSFLTLKQDADGRWWWFGAVSDNRLDRDKEILSERAHRKFVDAVENGTYEAVMGQKYPQAWVWHLDVPIGDATKVAYEENGFLIGAGPGYEGEFYDRVFTALQKYAQTHPDGLAMSHGMPNFTIERSKDDQSIIDGYLSKEFTFLPRIKAANLRTVAGAVSIKEEKMLQIRDDQREWFNDVFGEELTNEFGRRLQEVREAADAAGIPSKEHEMAKEEETVVQTEAAEAEAANPEKEAAEEAVEPEATVKQPEMDEEEEEEEEEENGNGKSYVTTEELDEALKEAAGGIAEGSNHILEQIKELGETVKALAQQVEALKEDSDTQVMKRIQDTPRASISSLFAESIAGKEGARVDYHKERQLHNAGPEEAEAKDAVTGIAHIDEAIQRQRSGQRVFPGYSALFGQADNGQES